MKKSGRLGPAEALVLIGPRGAGKSSVGRALSAALHWPLFSTDDMIRSGTGLRNDEFLRKRGWVAFRDLEQECVRRACGAGRRVVDTGGGAGIRPLNREWIRRHRVIFLDVDVESALGRLGSDADPHRPPLAQGLSQKEDWLKMIRERRFLYDGLSDLSLDASTSSPDALARRILALTMPWDRA